MVKGSGHANDRATVFDNPSKIESKRPHQWFVDAAEVDFFPNKKQAVEDANEKSSSGFSNVNFTPWENNPNFHSVPSQFISRLFGSETRSVNITEKNASYVSADDSNVRSKMITNQYGDDASFGLSISHSVEDSEACPNFGGIKKVQVNQVKDSDDVQALEGHNFNRQSNGDLHKAYNGEVETRSASIGQAFDKDGNVTLMGLTYSKGDAHVRSFDAPFGKGDDTVISIGESYNKEDTNIISFGGFSDERDIISVGRPATDYEQLYNQSSVHVSTTAHEKELDASNSDAVASTPQVATVKSGTVSKNKQEFKTTRKEAPNSFPSNVRSLISTGMLDGVPIKYVSVAREELRGIIKGSGYLCGCQSCNHSKVLNAYEFERHAGCKTKHPNNHIYFENGKTIYQIVQELRSTPESLLFDTIQTVFGSPINQKAFRNWKGKEIRLPSILHKHMPA
ncbi:Jas TPL-binding domain [Sesbania bispinosa]|nr:Jas TPL-binding domain [Sesbania bispinosa]